MGRGKSRDVSLIEELYWQQKQSDIPWFIHAAYRAIDHILINIDAFGGKEELNRLDALYKNLSEKEGKDFHEGVQTRMEWTVERLKELKIKNEKLKIKNGSCALRAICRRLRRKKKTLELTNNYCIV